jgi:hypothetical protein
MEARFWRGRACGRAGALAERNRLGAILATAQKSATKMLRRLRLWACSCIQELRIFAAASGNSTRNATILFAGTDPFNLDETAYSYFVYGERLSGGRLFGDTSMESGAGRRNSTRHANFPALERTERSPGKHPRSGHTHGPGECA